MSGEDDKFPPHLRELFKEIGRKVSATIPPQAEKILTAAGITAQETTEAIKALAFIQNAPFFDPRKAKPGYEGLTLMPAEINGVVKGLTVAWIEVLPDETKTSYPLFLYISQEWETKELYTGQFAAHDGESGRVN